MLLFLGAAVWLLYRSHVYTAPRTVDVAGLALTDLSGAPIPSNAVAGRPVVLNFWAPWCGPCRVEIPWLEALQRDHPEVTVIGVEDDPGALESGRAMASRDHISYRLAQPVGQVEHIFRDVATLPTTLYISRSGRVVHTATGVVPEPVMQYYLRDTLSSR
jgi:thiol-disulfide isomerase/thioredoxin